MVRGEGVTTRSGCKWPADTLVSQAESLIKLINITWNPFIGTQFHALPSNEGNLIWDRREGLGTHIVGYVGKGGMMLHILAGCMTVFSQGRYWWYHDKLLRALPEILEQEVQVSSPWNQHVPFSSSGRGMNHHSPSRPRRPTADSIMRCGWTWQGNCIFPMSFKLTEAWHSYMVLGCKEDHPDQTNGPMERWMHGGLREESHQVPRPGPTMQRQSVADPVRPNPQSASGAS